MESDITVEDKDLHKQLVEHASKCLQDAQWRDTHLRKALDEDMAEGGWNSQ